MHRLFSPSIPASTPPLPHARAGRSARNVLFHLSPLALASALLLAPEGSGAQTVVFGGPGTLWDQTANWVGGVAPGPLDTAELGSFSTAVRQNTTVRRFNGLPAGLLTLTGGTLSFSEASSIGRFVHTSGTLSSNAALVASGASQLSGVMTGSGSASFQAALSINNLALAGGYRVVAQGATSLLGSPSLAGGSRLDNEGSFTVDVASGSRTVAAGVGSGSFANSGTLTKSGNGLLQINVPYAQTAGGSTQVDAGRLLFGGGGVFDGNFGVANGARLEFRASTLTLDNRFNLAAGAFLGVGSGSVVTVASPFSSPGGVNLELGGTLNVNAATTLGALAKDGGTFGGSGAVTVAGPSVIAGAFSGSGSATFQDSLTINNMSLAGGYRIVAQGPTSLLQGLSLSNGSRLENAGTMTINPSFAFFVTGGTGGGAFANSGTVTHGGTSTLVLSVPYLQAASGITNVNSGTMQITAGGSVLDGRFNVASGGVLLITNNSFTLNDRFNLAEGGVLRITGGTATVAEPFSTAGVLEMTGGTLNVNAPSTLAVLQKPFFGDFGGSGAVTVTGPSAIGGNVSGSGSTTFEDALTIDGLALQGSYRLVSQGIANLLSRNSAWSAGTRLENAGLMTNNATTAWSISRNGSGAADFVNSGTFVKEGAALMNLNPGVLATNTGTLRVTAGALRLGGGLSNFAGTTLSGGGFEVIGDATLSFAAADVQTLDAALLLDGPGSQFINSGSGADALANLAASTAAGSLTLRNGRSLATPGAFNNAGSTTLGTGSSFTAGGSGFANAAGGSLLMEGGSLATSAGTGTLANAGTVSGFGTLAAAVNNSGTVLATGGVLNANGGITGATGRLQVAPGATLNLAAATAPGSTGALVLQGSLALGAQNLVVAGDYSNTGFGTGNAFDARAGVTGSGQIIGSGAVLALGGQASPAGANAWVLDFGTVRGGSSATRSFTVQNAGSAGAASLRTALQTAANGAAVSDARLSGTALVAGNLALLAAGSASDSFVATLAGVSTGGALTGQVLAVAGNFANTLVQTLALQGFSTVLASGAASPAGPLNLGNFRVGISPAPSSNLAINNLASGPGAEQLRLGPLQTSGNFSAINNLGGSSVAPGASVADAVRVASAAGVAGPNAGAVTLQFTSNGQAFAPGFTDLAVNQQTVQLNATGFRLANPTLATPNPVLLPNQRVGGSLTQALTLANNLPADGFSESLNASISASGQATAGGSFNLLAAGASSSALFVGVDTSSAGQRSGVATVALASDGTGSSGFAALAVGSQTVNVSGDVYRLAVPQLGTSLGLLAARVGDVQPVATLAVANAGPDAFTERLNASFGSVPAGFTSGPALLGVAPGASGNLTLALATGTAGNFGGNAQTLLVSSGAGTTGAPDAPLPAAKVAVQGRVYAPAVPAVPLTVVDFGIVRMGDSVAARSVAVGNTASGALTDSLRAEISSGSAAFTAAGSALVPAGQTNASALTVTLDTGTAGAFSGSGQLGLASVNPDLADRTLAAQPIGFAAQVNNLAAPVFTASGATLSGGGLNYTLDFGSFTEGTGAVQATLQLANLVAGPADNLSGSWALDGLGTPFAASGFNSFANLAPGGQVGGLLVSLGDVQLGSFSGSIRLASFSVNGVGPDLALGDVVINLQGQVVAVPEPSTYALFLGGLALLLLSRRRLQQQRHDAGVSEFLSR